MCNFSYIKVWSSTYKKWVKSCFLKFQKSSREQETWQMVLINEKIYGQNSRQQHSNTRNFKLFLYYCEKKFHNSRKLPYKTTYYNELKRGQKSILLGQCIVCLKGFSQRFLKFFRGEGSRRGPRVKTKINVFWNFFFIQSRSPSETLHSKKFQKTLILAFDANRALSCQNGLFSWF